MADRKNTVNSFRKVTREGAKILREIYGRDWHTKIDLTKLEMISPRSCILGQLFGDYEIGCEKLPKASDDSLVTEEEPQFKYGFSLWEGNAYGWSALTQAWKRQVKEYSRPR